MSFFQTLRRALGFGSDDDDDDVLLDEHTEVTEVPDDANQPEAESATPSQPSEPAPTFDPAMSAAILDGVLRVFNTALPDFLQRSIDPEAQRRALADSLDESVRQYMASLAATADRHAEARLRSATDAAHAESERLRREMERLEQQKTSIREQQLSSDRRRRALEDRARDLEEQVQRLEAEREQFELENRSLLNKIKLADVQPGIVDELHREIARLRQGQPAEDTAAVEKAQTEIAALHQQIAALESANATLNAERDGLEAKLAELSAAEEDLHKHQADLEAGSAVAKEMISKLQEELSGEREQRLKTEEQLAQANDIEQSMLTMQEQLGQVETVIAKRDERIARLKATNKKLKDENASLREQLDHVVSESKGLFDIADSEHMVADDDFECPDWFVSEPGPDTPPLRQPNSDFGYTEPPRKPRVPDNDAQLTLF